ncbi:hypothetical protein CEXT_785271 [Caerostris extrusa]|uniref:Uncharacterized protein n=1 Tax=Caerostris extrusa TaxID=172846 RepID=A0AAV4YCR1_CAEEX|nr:hypothetical protein CEXT_785271 [Caerostris extrusa]
MYKCPNIPELIADAPDILLVAGLWNQCIRISNCLALSLSDSIQIRFLVYRRVRLAQIKKTGQRHSWAGFRQTLLPQSSPVVL